MDGGLEICWLDNEGLLWLGDDDWLNYGLLLHSASSLASAAAAPSFHESVLTLKFLNSVLAPFESSDEEQVESEETEDEDWANWAGAGMVLWSSLSMFSLVSLSFVATMSELLVLSMFAVLTMSTMVSMMLTMLLVMSSVMMHVLWWSWWHWWFNGWSIWDLVILWGHWLLILHLWLDLWGHVDDTIDVEGHWINLIKLSILWLGNGLNGGIVLLVDLVDELVHVAHLSESEEADEDDEEHAAGRLLAYSVGPCGTLSPGHELSAFADGGDLCEDEEGQPRAGLDSVIKIELILGDEFLLVGLGTSLVLWWEASGWMAKLISNSADDMSGSELGVQGGDHTDDTDDHEAV